MLRAAINGHVDCVKLLIALSNVEDSGALKMAAQNGRSECVSLLMKIKHPVYDINNALRLAAIHGHVDCVTLLIPLADPKEDNSQALFAAATYGRTACMDALLVVSDVHKVVHRLRSSNPDSPQVWQHLEEREIKRQRECLIQSVDTTTVVCKTRKI